MTVITKQNQIETNTTEVHFNALHNGWQKGHFHSIFFTFLSCISVRAQNFGKYWTMQVNSMRGGWFRKGVKLICSKNDSSNSILLASNQSNEEIFAIVFIKQEDRKKIISFHFGFSFPSLVISFYAITTDMEKLKAATCF